MKRANNNRRRADSWRRQFSLLLAVTWLVSFLQPCLMAAGGNVYASFADDHKIHQLESVGVGHHNSTSDDDQHSQAGVDGDHQGCESCPTGHSGSGDCCPAVSGCCSDQPSYISSPNDKLDANDIYHKLEGSGFPALFSIENQTESGRQFSHAPPELFPPGPSVQSKYRVYLK